MFDLKALTTENLIECIGVLVTLGTIIGSLFIARKSLRDALAQQKTENALKNIDALPEMLNDFINTIISLLVCTFVNPDETKKQEVSAKFDEIFDKLQYILLMYGSITSIRVFKELKTILMKAANGGTVVTADIFALAILLCVQVRHDLMNEDISLRYFVELIMARIPNQKDEVYESCNKYISTFKMNIKK